MCILSYSIPSKVPASNIIQVYFRLVLKEGDNLILAGSTSLKIGLWRIKMSLE